MIHDIERWAVRASHEPWKHLVIDNFLKPETMGSLSSDILLSDYQFEIDPRGSGQIEFAVCESEIGWKAISSGFARRMLEHIFDVRLEFDTDNMVQVRQMSGSSPPFPIHSDHIEGMDYIVTFLYVSPNWEQSCGGELLLSSTRKKDKTTKIEPVQNRLVAFRSELDNLHQVTKVNNWRRCSLLAMWNVK